MQFNQVNINAGDVVNHSPPKSLNESERKVMRLITEAMSIIVNDWKMVSGENLGIELTTAVHAMQGYVIQHMLQRTEPGWGEWFDMEKSEAAG